ncbi:hypothetical protein CBW46_011155 [Paenibacillus xerothermodurans]|uniref:Collagen-like protein n=1 Tax=Paenibacillus xerothermodurans TaxID=1977292 RepID=A0A2W1NCS1_PAEXE|nr:hypothetical protein CBW46_011155 [Paenibacillus xerothermodurans]
MRGAARGYSPAPVPGGGAGFPPGGGVGFPPGGVGGFPPGGAPGGFPPGGVGGFPPGGAPGGQPPGAPGSPPPSFVPSQPQVGAYAVDPGSIRRCLYRYVYIWQDNGQQYWIYLTFVGRRSIAGYRWHGYGAVGVWLYFGLDLRRIDQFACF